MSEQAPGALDRLVRMDPSQVANFILATSVVRQAIASAGEVLLVLPERGAMPIYWGADGIPADEGEMAHDGSVQLPIGSYDFLAVDERIKKGTLTNQQKQAIVGRHSAELQDADRVLVLDEVQKGGTLTELVGIIQKRRDEEAKRLYVVAAQDSRRKVAAEPKKDVYQQMITGNRQGVIANVVPMPLIGTDCDALLNRLWYAGNKRTPVEYSPNIEVHPNEEAQIILRTLGMASRNREALEDTSVLDRDVFSYSLGEKAASRIEQWRHMLLSNFLERLSY